MGTYTDKIHLVGDTIQELKQFAEKIGLNKCWYEGVKKGHPHYDLVNEKKKALICKKTGKRFIDKAIEQGAKVVGRKEVFRISVASWSKEYRRTAKQLNLL